VRATCATGRNREASPRTYSCGSSGPCIRALPLAKAIPGPADTRKRRLQGGGIVLGNPVARCRGSHAHMDDAPLVGDKDRVPEPHEKGGVGRDRGLHAGQHLFPDVEWPRWRRLRLLLTGREEADAHHHQDEPDGPTGSK
jgi:hypothetical protein